MGYPGRDGYILSGDADARTCTRVYDGDGEGEIVQVLTQDCKGIMDVAKEQRDYGTSSVAGGKRRVHVGFIPNYMIPELNRLGILQDSRLLREFLDSSEFSRFRTNPMALSAKGMKTKYGGTIVGKNHRSKVISVTKGG